MKVGAAQLEFLARQALYHVPFCGLVPLNVRDADTTGAVCGQLAGAYRGESGIPQEWREGLAGKGIIEPILSRLPGSQR